MVHSAFDSFSLVEKSSQKIDAISALDSTLLLSCSDGSLRIYGPESATSSDYDADPTGLKKEKYSLVRTITGFTKKTMLGMEVLGSKELLLCLSEAISIHRVPSFETLAVITKAKGANVYAWDDRRGVLCFARQKRVCIFRHDGGRGFVEVKDFGVPDHVKSISWCGENICIGIRREYMILNASNGSLSEVFPSGRSAPPLVVSLPSGELLLGKDNIGVLVDQNGKLVQGGRICWSEAPGMVVIQKPYAMGLLPRHVEIRSLREPYPLIQTVGLRNVRKLLRSNHTIIVALDDSVYGLFPVPLGAQIIQLTASANFEEALALCKLLPPEDSSLRAAKEQSIHIRYAHSLFENGSYEEAMDHFVSSQVNITYVLSLYPSIIIPKSASIPEPEKFEDLSGDGSHLSRGSSGMSDDIEASPSYMLDADEDADLESKKMNHNTLMGLVKYLHKKRSTIVEKAAAEGTEEVVSDAVGNFASYNLGRSKKANKGRANPSISSVARDMAAILDTALLQALLLTVQTSGALELLKGPNYCDIKICEEFLQKSNRPVCLLELYKSNTKHREALELLHQLVEQSESDNSPPELRSKFKPEVIIEYLKPLCETDPMLVLEFSTLVLQRCPTETIELFLSGNIPADLVNSYLKQHAPNMQATYLELMLAMNENSIPGNLQNEMVQIYLSEVLDWYSDLKAQGNWSEQTYTPTRKKLLSALGNVSGYKPEVLFQRLPSDSLCEERAILLGKMNQHELALSIYIHKLHLPELAVSYCDRIYESGLQQPGTKSSGNIYLTLLQIYLNPQKSTKNYEKRISTLLSSQRTGSPKGAPGSPKGIPGTYSKNRKGRSRKIAEIDSAENILTAPSETDSGRSDGDADADDAADIVSTIMLDQVLNLLSTRWERMHGAKALKLLPKETKLQNLLPFLGPLLRKSSEAYRNFSVIKSLRESENLQVKDDLFDQRKTVVKITGNTMCSLCSKKIGTSVFAVYPNGKTIVHFVCFRDSQNMKVSGKGSTLRKR